ncbi:hypothetical protein FKW81_08085 [Rhodobacter capsulatus]|uniref:hypothetical protein n=2 Tax=Rhodobacter capsulatus TaxID=1061 RepID=UPI0011444F4B|nr:hypothetical protein [Rhodobacter capsulatus]TQD35578.1 hypothetical protein FKW81_08085 [Rhodobacter capsulatus]
MASTNLNISVIEKRMFRESEAASYSGLAVKHFKIACPVQPIQLRPGVMLWDKRDLDLWIDDVKTGTHASTHDAILGRL